MAKYKFKDWTTTTGRGLRVDDRMRESRAEEIALALSDISRWNSHGYGIAMDVLEHDLKLKIDDFGSAPELAGAIRDYRHLLTDFLGVFGIEGVIHGVGTVRYSP